MRLILLTCIGVLSFLIVFLPGYFLLVPRSHTETPEMPISLMEESSQKQESSLHETTTTPSNEKAPELPSEEKDMTHALPAVELNSHAKRIPPEPQPDISELKKEEHPSASEPKTVSHEKEPSLPQHQKK